MGISAIMTNNVPPSSPPPEHRSVLAEEALALLVTDRAGTYIDGTTGLGGHTALLADMLTPQGRIIAIDRDEESLAKARQRLSGTKVPVTFHRDNFKNLPLILNRLEVKAISGLLLDLGISSFQLLSPERGFSFQHDGPLDMRMDQSQKTTAAELVNNLPEAELADIIYQYGEERRSRAIARRIVEQRQVHRFSSTRELAELVTRVMGPAARRAAIHPATRTFQALRIAVNKELDGLGELLEKMVDVIEPGGRMVIISFHSLEDRIVKTAFNRLAGRCVCRRPVSLCTCPRKERVRVLTRKPIAPGAEEIATNPRARSARLRAVEVMPREEAGA